MMSPLRSLHYGWIIVLSGVLTIVAVLGLGRFSLGMILPSMGNNLKLEYSQMGYIGTGNFIGYLLAVLLSSRLLQWIGFRKLISGGIFLVGASMIVVGCANDFWWVFFAFFLTGCGSGFANVPVMALVSHWFGPSLRGRAAGFMVSGSGLGIMITGLLVPAINRWDGSDASWRWNWMVLGALVLGIGMVCTALLRNSPQDVGLTVLEKSGQKANNTVIPATIQPSLLSPSRIISHLGSIYFLFGFTYVVYVTFVVTTLIHDYGFTEITAGRFWFWFGLLGVFSGPVFGSLSDRLGRTGMLTLVFLLLAAAHFLLAVHPQVEGIYLSIGLFALCAWSVPSIVAAAVGDYLGPFKAASGFAAVTLLFGLGQIIGPSLAGILADVQGNFFASYCLAGVLSTFAAILSLFLPKMKT